MQQVLDGDLALIEVILYGVAQVKLIPSGEHYSLILPKQHSLHVGDLCNITNDHRSLIA